MAPNTVIAPKLPISVVSTTDIGRLIREIEAVDEHLLQYELKGTASILPVTSLILNETVAANGYDLLLKEQRQQLLAFLKQVKQQAPVLHISFGSEPNEVFTGKLITWLRQEIHPAVLITIGLQPSIGAGCLVRSSNKYFDFSLRKQFSENRNLLMSKIREAVTA